MAGLELDTNTRCIAEKTEPPIAGPPPSDGSTMPIVRFDVTLDNEKGPLNGAYLQPRSRCDVTVPAKPMPNLSNAASRISLRRARQRDFAFAIELYLDSARPLLTALGVWDEGRIVSRFGQAFTTDQVRVIRLDGIDVGWMQVSESTDQLRLHQLHIVPRCQNVGIGSRLIQDLLRRARRVRRPVALNVMRGNRALSLYRRHGFRIVGGDPEKLHMRWDEAPPKRR